MRKVVSILLTICMSVSLWMPVNVSAESSTGSYNINKSVSYAKAHWDDGVGLCADFCSACLRAGGINVNISGTRSLMNYLVDNGYASTYLLTTVQKTSLKWSNYSDKVSPGDIIINYCPTCKVYPHVVLVSDDKSDGYIHYYAHNSARNNKKYSTGSGGYKSHSGHSFETYVIHINNSTYGDAPQPKPIHTHSFTEQVDNSHPHNIYKICSCGEKLYTGTSLNSDCKQCYPLGSTSLAREYEKTKGKVTFYRSNVSNATSYTLKLYKDNSLYNTYTMSSTSKYISNLPSGEYYGQLTVENDNTGEKKTVTSRTFTLKDTYSIIFNANGGKNAPSVQTKIEDTPMSIPTAIPTRNHYIFEGWARSKNASKAEYKPNDSYTRNAKATLYAIWKPETYTVKFDTNGGKGTLEDISVVYGNTAQMPNTIVKDGYYLKGWAKTKNATTVDYKLGMDIAIEENLTLYAIWGNSTWGGDVATTFSGGDGTKDNPYLISNSGELAYLAKIVNSQASAPEYKYYKLTDNINLGYMEWVPIGIADNENQYFSGSFDGNGFTISDLYISTQNSGYIGLFGKTDNSIFSNLNIAGTVENVKSTKNKTFIGGLIGNSVDTTLQGCNVKYFSLSSLSVGTDEYSFVGGLTGAISGNGKISDCTALDCSINMKEGLYESGIIVGYSSVDITDCDVVSTEDGLFSTASTISGYTIGGIAGKGECNFNKCTVSAPYLANEISTGTKETHIAGLVGDLTGTAKVCSVDFTSGNVKTIDGKDYASSVYASGTNNITIGGIAGYTGQNTKIKDCKYDGQSISGTTTSGYSAIGGMVGYANAKAKDSISVRGDEYLSYGDLPKKEGYIATWYTDPTFTTPYTFGNKLTSDITLYAKWEEGEAYDSWDGTSKEPAYNADTMTYTITNGEELAWISDVSNGIITTGTNMPSDKSFAEYTVELANDIYLNDTTGWENWSETNAPKNQWKPIGKGTSFKGTINGNHFGIYGMYINVSDSNVGLIGRAKEGTSITGLNVNCGFISGEDAIGAIVGCMYDDITFSSCSINMNIKGNSGIGGIAGSTTEINGTFTDCHTKGTITATSNFAGGISPLGKKYDFCSNSANITGYAYTGGIAARGTSVYRCYNAGDIVSQTFYTGGIAGDSFYDDEIKYCYNIGEVTGGNCVGGIVGTSQHSIIEDSYNIGRITATYDCAGGITGDFNCGTIKNCYNRSGVISEGDDEGSICGYMYGSTDDKVYMYNCYGSNYPLYTTSSSRDECILSNVSYISSYDMFHLSSFTGFSNNYWMDSGVWSVSPRLISLADSYKTYNVTTVTDSDTSLISRSFANVDGILYANAPTSYSGGLIGYGDAKSNAVSTVDSTISIANTLKATGTTSKTGYVIGYNKNNAYTFDKSYYNSDVVADSITDTTGTSRATRLIKMTSFLETQLGLGKYTDVANVSNDETAVWVIRDGELPELYYNCLNDITISENIENGKITLDKTQAVDGEVVTVTATPNENYLLSKIFVNGAEIVGTTFEVSGDSEVYALFAEKPAEYTVEIETTENANATITNVDEAQMELMAISTFAMDFNGSTDIIATDGEEIQINAVANEDYTIDAIYNNGEEVTGTSFIITEDSVVTMEVTSLKTDITAVTNDAEDVGDHFALVGGSVDNESDDISRYIRYWSSDDADTVYITDVEEGSGEYTANIIGLESNTKYYYQMTEYGEIKSFTTLPTQYEEADIEAPDTPEDTTIAVTSVALNKSITSIIEGQTEILTATIEPNNATNKEVIWSSNNTNVATVSDTGVVTAKTAGTADITVTTSDGGKTAKCSVTVTAIETPPLNDAKAIFTLSDVSGKAGDNVKVKLSLKSSEDINTIAISELTYSDALTFTGFSDYDAISKLAAITPTFDDTNKAIVVGLKEASKFDGDICTLNFKINDSAEDGELSVSASSIARLNSVPVSSTVESATVTVISQLLGDINGDNTVDLQDAITLLNHSMLPTIYPINYVGNVDFNKDGCVDLQDAILLLNYSMLPGIYPIN